jgi:hypothetical protein
MWRVQFLQRGNVLQTFTYKKEKVAKAKYELLKKNLPTKGGHGVTLIPPTKN